VLADGEEVDRQQFSAVEPPGDAPMKKPPKTDDAKTMPVARTVCLQPIHQMTVRIFNPPIPIKKRPKKKPRKG
jgi:hypothetical protein